MCTDNFNQPTSIPPELAQSLVESYDLLEKMAQIGKIGAWIVDTETKMSTWTKELFSIMEMDSTIPLSLEEILLFELPPYRLLHRKAVLNLMESGTPFDIEVETLTVKGNHRWLRIIGKGLYDMNRKMTHRIGITQDITKQKMLEQQAIENLKRYVSLFEGISDAVLVLDDHTGQVCDVNLEAMKLYGYSYEEFLTISYRNLLAYPETDPASSEQSPKPFKDRKSFVPLERHKKRMVHLFR